MGRIKEPTVWRRITNKRLNKQKAMRKTCLS